MRSPLVYRLPLKRVLGARDGEKEYPDHGTSMSWKNHFG
jgi:hypothetical protein